MLECFGDLDTDERIIQVIKEDKDPKAKGKEAPMKKVGDQQEQPKPVDVVQKLGNYNDFITALNKVKMFDQMM